MSWVIDRQYLHFLEVIGISSFLLQIVTGETLSSALTAWQVYFGLNVSIFFHTFNEYSFVK
jgi:hypothetical protein